MPPGEASWLQDGDIRLRIGQDVVVSGGRSGAGQWASIAPWLNMLWWRCLLVVFAVIFGIRNAHGTAQMIWIAVAGLVFVAGLAFDVRRRHSEA